MQVWLNDYIRRTVLQTLRHAVLETALVDLPSNFNTLAWEVVGRFKCSQLPLPIRRTVPETTSD